MVAVVLALGLGIGLGTRSGGSSSATGNQDAQKGTGYTTVTVSVFAAKVRYILKPKFNDQCNPNVPPFFNRQLANHRLDFLKRAKKTKAPGNLVKSSYM